MECTFCNKIVNGLAGLSQHQKYCKSNPDRVEKIGSSNAGRKKGKQYYVYQKGKPAWNKGLEGKKGPKHSQETKDIIAQQKIELYASGWEPTCGRCKKISYTSPIAGEVKLDGNWEVIMAQYLDKEKINWVRNRVRFPYIRPEGKNATYQPDFYLRDLDVYIEVKGYETDLDRCKWSQFPKKLLVVRKDDIKNLEAWGSGLTQQVATLPVLNCGPSVRTG